MVQATNQNGYQWGEIPITVSVCTIDYQPTCTYFISINLKPLIFHRQFSIILVSAS